MTAAIEGLEPGLLWSMFANVSRFPRGSKNEAALAAYLRKTARDKGFEVKKDPTGNLCIRVPATPGFENAPVTVLQAHLDMVCEKNDDVEFDFGKEGIRLVRNGEWLRADGTTLGADNGIGLAAALAAAWDDSLNRGPLELLLTVDEETGLTGVFGLDPHLVSGRILLNLDSEHTGSLCMGCAGGGGVDSSMQLAFSSTPADCAGYMLTVSGLQGGHSGLNINENRGNAVKIVSRLLRALSHFGLDIAEIRGGDKHNAIPREATAVVCLPSGTEEKVQEIIKGFTADIGSEYPDDADFALQCSPVEKPARVFTSTSRDAVIDMLLAFPNGVMSMSRTIDGLVETSNNVASVRMEGDYLTVHNSPRSSVAAALQATVEQIVAVAELAGAQNEIEKPYPGWQPNPDSRVLHLVESVHEELFGFSPEREATHAGLECGIIGDLLPGMDMISFGADIINCHSPDEAVKIESVGRFWELLCGVLGAIAAGKY